MGGSEKQIGYISIIDKRNNWVGNIKTRGIYNKNQNYQHIITQIDIAVKLKNNNETHIVGNLNYNINDEENKSELTIDDGIDDENKRNG